ncbi:MAG: hypothetical protein WA691_05860 [Thermoplasmata archaeon]
MNILLLVGGVVFGGGAVVVWVLTHLDPLPSRQRHRLIRMLRYRARRAGLRGRFDVTQPNASRGLGSYEPADDTDRALYAAVGSSIESESAFFARDTLWTDERLAWAGIVLFLIGVVLIVFSVLT